MSIAFENNFQQTAKYVNGNTQSVLGESMMQTNTIAIVGYDAATARLCSTPPSN